MPRQRRACKAWGGRRPGEEAVAARGPKERAAARALAGGGRCWGFHRAGAAEPSAGFGHRPSSVLTSAWRGNPPPPLLPGRGRLCLGLQPRQARPALLGSGLPAPTLTRAASGRILLAAGQRFRNNSSAFEKVQSRGVFSFFPVRSLFIFF